MQLYYKFIKNLHSKRFYIKHFIIFYSVGLIGHTFSQSREFMFLLTPFFLLTFGIFSLCPYLLKNNKFIIYFVIVATIFTYLIEVAGVKTGIIFGQYTYIDNLGKHIFNVPPVIGFNWVLIILGGVTLSEVLTTSKILQIIITASSAVFIDWIMEPVAITFHYWKWTGSVIPLQNYIAWFIIAFIFSIPLIIKNTQLSKISLYYFLTQIIYFSILRIFIETDAIQ